MTTSIDIISTVKNEESHWSGIWALTTGVSGLMIAEYLPAGVLTSMATDLHISEGMAGQSITATSIFAVIASLVIAYSTRNYNRKTVLLTLSSFLTISSIIVAKASSLEVLLFGRVLLGIALGGFWSMATAIAIRLVPSRDVPKALSIIFGGASFSAVLAAPLGSYIGNIMGWRNVFLLAALVGLLSTLWQFFKLPSLKPTGVVKLRTIVDVIKIPQFGIGMIAISLAFCGRFASFTYLRPFLEQRTHLSGSTVSIAFMVFDIAYFVGTLFASKIVSKSFLGSLKWPPVILSITCLGLIVGGSSFPTTLILLAILGIAFAPIPVVWSTWAAATAPDNTETAGGLYVAAVQFSAGVGAFVGGGIFDLVGSTGVFALCAVTWILSTMLVVAKIKNIPNNH